MAVSEPSNNTAGTSVFKWTLHYNTASQGGGTPQVGVGGGGWNRPATRDTPVNTLTLTTTHTKHDAGHIHGDRDTIRDTRHAGDATGNAGLGRDTRRTAGRWRDN